MKTLNLPANDKKDFYLRFLLLHLGQTFTAETLFYQKRYYLKHRKFYPGNEIIAEPLFEEYIPCCDNQTITEIKNRMDYLINLISACMENNQSEKLNIARKELDELAIYLKKSCSRKGKINFFSTSHDHLKTSVMKSIYRSLATLKKENPDYALQIQRQLQFKPEIGIKPQA